MEVCDDFTVLRDGELIKSDTISNTDKDQLITSMVWWDRVEQKL